MEFMLWRMGGLNAFEVCADMAVQRKLKLLVTIKSRRNTSALVQTVMKALSMSPC